MSVRAILVRRQCRDTMSVRAIHVQRQCHDTMSVRNHAVLPHITTVEGGVATIRSAVKPVAQATAALGLPLWAYLAISHGDYSLLFITLLCHVGSLS